MDKNQQLKLRKLYNNYIPKFDIGTTGNPIASGYQRGYNINTDTFTSTPSENYLPQASALKTYNLQSGITKAAGYATNIAQNLSKNYITKAAAAKADAIATNALGSTGAGVAGSKYGLNSTGKVMAGVGAAISAYDLVSGLAKTNTDYVHSQDILNSSGTATQSDNGVQYTAYTGFDEKGIRDYTNAQNTGTTLNSTLSGASMGASIGSFFPGPGTLIGTILGGLGGLISGSIFGNKRKNKVEEAMRRMRTTQAGYNLLAQSEAGSKGMQNQYNLTHANKGMDAYNPSAYTTESKAKSQKYGIVWTPDGKQYGPINSLIGKNESIIDFDKGKATYVSDGTKRVDNQGSVAQNGDNITIIGNDKDWNTGRLFSDTAAPYTIMAQKANNIIEGKVKNQSNETRQKNIEEAMKLKNYAFANLKKIADQLEYLHVMLDRNKYNCGKIAKYDTGTPLANLSPWQDYTWANMMNMPTPTWTGYQTYNNEDYSLPELYAYGHHSYPPISDPGLYGALDLPDINVPNIRPNVPLRADTSILKPLPFADTEKDALTLPELNINGRKPGANIRNEEVANLFKQFSNNWLPYALMMGPAFEQYAYYKGHRPTAQNSYIANPVAGQALKALASMRYDPYRQVRALGGANREAIYNINHSGGLSRGQRLAMLSTLNDNYARNLAGIYANADIVNNQYKQAFASGLMGEGRDAATRQQKALATLQEAYRQAVARDRKGVETAEANMLNIAQHALQNRYRNMMAAGILGTYHQDLTTDQLAAIAAYQPLRVDKGKDRYRLTPKRRKK